MEQFAWPATLIDGFLYLADPDRALSFLSALRWPDGVACPNCGSNEVGFLKTRRLWKCKNNHAKRQFPIRVGSIFEDSPLSLDNRLVTMWPIANCKNGIRSCEVARGLKVTRQTAWFMLHRFRLAMQRGSFRKWPVRYSENG